MKRILSSLVVALLLSGFQFTPLTALGATFTMQDVQAHNTAADCWTVVNGNVYNLTSFISSHPGGVGTISSICGVDGTAAFTAQHSGSANANSVLASLLIGTLAAPADTVAPSIPAGLTTSVISDTRIDLTWAASTDNVAVTGYNVYRNSVLVGTSTGMTFSDTGLVASTTYTYTVAAFDQAGNISGQSNPVSATTLQTPVVTPPPVVGNENEHEVADHKNELKQEHADGGRARIEMRVDAVGTRIEGSRRHD